MNKDDVIKKIRKCLALSKSANENEAATAMRQAKALMDAHQIADADLLAAEAEEAKTQAMKSKNPPSWEGNLAWIVADAFGCRSVLKHSVEYDSKNLRMVHSRAWAFVGCGMSAEVAKYTFDVLYRQIKRARTGYIKHDLKRCATTTKVRRADLFCLAYVNALEKLIKAFATPPTERQLGAIDAYFDKRYPELGKLKPINRNDPSKLKPSDHKDLLSGQVAAQSAELHRGVGGTGTPTLIGGVVP